MECGLSNNTQNELLHHQTHSTSHRGNQANKAKKVAEQVGKTAELQKELSSAQQQLDLVKAKRDGLKHQLKETKLVTTSSGTIRKNRMPKKTQEQSSSSGQVKTNVKVARKMATEVPKHNEFEMDIDSNNCEPPSLSDLYSEVQSPSGDVVGDFSVHNSESEVQADTHQTLWSTSPASHALPLVEEKAELDDNVQNAQTLHQSQSAEDSALAESSVPATQTVATTDLTAWHAFKDAIAQPFLDVDLYNPPNSVETYIPHYTNSFNFDYPSFNFGPVDWSSDERVSDLPRSRPPHRQFLHHLHPPYQQQCHLIILWQPLSISTDRNERREMYPILQKLSMVA
ncbi:hypothetical protein E1B28_002932 [Marasmius oreades]|uniref:Uncharacterized protein n=1 Tax=Marasmius oreades TaxID=181124 RepID=A0A9P7UMW6_9AGAR|nr:uncharacterized protein E1B28_002932 [Marasmius oreades]KAG7085369.1 hypothetical protein E1B28_002932 [Marasmius oreades]